MKQTTKGQIVLAALRKVGIASNATLTDVEPQSVEDGLEDLELMMSEWLMGDECRGLDLGFSFSDAGVAALPDDLHNLPPFSVNAVITNLSIRMLTDYGQEPSATLVAKARYGKELLLKWLAKRRTPHLTYPNRMPVGSGNRIAAANGLHYFHRRKRPCR